MTTTHLLPCTHPKASPAYRAWDDRRQNIARNGHRWSPEKLAEAVDDANAHSGHLIPARPADILRRRGRVLTEAMETEGY